MTGPGAAGATETVAAGATESGAAGATGLGPGRGDGRMSDRGANVADGSGSAAVVTATRYPSGYASIRSLGKRGIRTITAVEHADLPVTASRYCEEAVEVPATTDLAAYREALLELACRDDVETVVPHRRADTFVLSQDREAFERHVDVVVPGPDVLRVAHDRLRLAEIAERAGVAVPETGLLTTVEDWSSEQLVRPRYPILTDAYVDDLPAGEARVPSTVEHLPSGRSPDVQALLEAMDHEPIVQPQVPTQHTYGFGALYHRGTALATYHQRTIRADSVAGGCGVYRETVADPDLEAAGRAVLDELEWHGLACVEFVENAETGRYELTDLRPGMWESLPVAVRSGADFPHWYWLQTRGDVDKILPDYEVGVGSHYLSGELAHLRSVLASESEPVDGPSFSGTAWEVLASCARSRNFDYVHRDDLSPALRQLRNGVSRAVGRRL